MEIFLEPILLSNAFAWISFNWAEIWWGYFTKIYRSVPGRWITGNNFKSCFGLKLRLFLSVENFCKLLFKDLLLIVGLRIYCLNFSFYSLRCFTKSSAYSFALKFLDSTPCKVRKSTLLNLAPSYYFSSCKIFIFAFSRSLLFFF